MAARRFAPPTTPLFVGGIFTPLGVVADGKLFVNGGSNGLLVYDPQSETWTSSESYPSAPAQLQHACVHDGRIIVFLANGHGGGTLVRAADGSWAPYEGAVDAKTLEELHGPLGEWYAASDLRARHGAYPETPKALEAWLAFGKAFEQFLAATGEPPSAGWGPRNAFSFASAPAGASKHGVSASVLLG